MTNLQIKNLTPTEKQAQKLWAIFDPEKPEGFWRKYDALRKKCKVVKPKPNEIATSTTASKTKVARKQVFLQHINFLIGQFGFFLSFAGMIIIPIVQFFPAEFDIVAASMLLLVLVGIPTSWITTLSDIVYFRVNDEQLMIIHPFIFSRKLIKWERIHSIEIEKGYQVSDDPDPCPYNLLLKLDTGFHCVYAYKPSAKTHKAFLYELSKRVKKIVDDDYQGYI